jgi:hypothetical protein
MAGRAGGGNGPSGERNKFRLLFVDGDLSTEGMQQLTQALTNAFRPVAIPSRRPPTLKGGLDSVENGNDVSQEDELDDAGDQSMTSEPLQVSSETVAPRTPRKRTRPPLPTYQADLDLTSQSVPFKAFASQIAPKKHSRRYLIVAAWFKDHAGRDAIGTDDIYTCYKTVGWPLSIADWDKPLRQLVNQDWMRRVEEGRYTITPLGEDKLTRKGDEE